MIYTWNQYTAQNLKKLNKAITQWIKTAAVKKSKSNGIYMETSQFIQATNQVLYCQKFLKFQQGKRIAPKSLAKARALGNVSFPITTFFHEAT